MVFRLGNVYVYYVGVSLWFVGLSGSDVVWVLMERTEAVRNCTGTREPSARILKYCVCVCVEVLMYECVCKSISYVILRPIKMSHIILGGGRQQVSRLFFCCCCPTKGVVGLHHHHHRHATLNHK